MSVGDYIIMELPLYTDDSTNTFNDQHNCRVDFQRGLNAINEADDFMVVKKRSSSKSDVGYFVKKWQSSWASSTFQYFTCKHFEFNLGVQYSVGKSTVYPYYYPLKDYSAYSYYQSPNNYGDYMKYMSPSKTRTLIEFDLTNTINTITWDPTTDYYLQVDLSYYGSPYPMSGVTGCRVLSGVVAGVGVPQCLRLSTTSVLIGKLTQIVRSSRVNGYRVKM